MVTSPFEHRRYPCPHCQIGNLHPSPTFFCGWYDDQFISAPDFPAWICDICGSREYDLQAVIELDTILQLDQRRRKLRGTRHTPKSNLPPLGQPVNSRRG